MKVDGRVLQDSLELTYEDGKGYHIKAKRKLKAGSTVFEEKPCAVALPGSAAKRLCRSCLMVLPPKLIEDPIKCGRCQLAHYCSHKCRKADTGPHEATGECFLLQDSKLAEEIGGYIREACLALRLLQCKRGEPPFLSNWDKFIGPNSGDDAHMLCVMAPAVSAATRAAVAANMPGAAARDDKAAAEAICQVFTNALEVLPSMPVVCACDSQMSSPGPPPAAMYRLVCRMNHSCRANAAYHFKLGGAISVRTTVDVEPDEEVCISYLDALQPLARRESDLLHRFCFKCGCERCASESSSFERALQSLEATERAEAGSEEERVALPPAIPTWFLSAVAPAGLPRTGLPRTGQPESMSSSQVQAAGAAIRAFLDDLMRKAEDLFIRQGNAVAAWSILEAGILQAVRMGVHPYHHRCLDVYACLASACRVCAKLGMGAAAMRRAALFGLLQAGAAEAVLAAGEYGAMPQAARNWSETGAILCEVVAAELSELKRGQQSSSATAGNRHINGNSGLQQLIPEPTAEPLAADAAPVELRSHNSAQTPRHQSAQDDPQPSSSNRKRRRSCNAASAAAWPALLPDEAPAQAEVVGSNLAQRPSEKSPSISAIGKKKAIPEPSKDFAAAVCAAWSSLACARNVDSAAAANSEADAEQRGGAADSFNALGGPAGFLSCAEAAPVNKALLAALCKELNGAGACEADVQRLERIATGAAHCLAHAAGLLQVVAGPAHPLTESAGFCAFFAGLPYSIASVITYSASRLADCG